jgi:hypothetical protein
MQDVTPCAGTYSSLRLLYVFANSKRHIVQIAQPAASKLDDVHLAMDEHSKNPEPYVYSDDS